jgi:hypothetical protein
MERKRLFIKRKTSNIERPEIVKWAAGNGYDTLVFSMDDKYFSSKRGKYIKLIKKYTLNIEAGGNDFSLLLPKKLFFFHRGLFRMEQGRRKSSPHFCPTNPKTTSIIAENAHTWFTHSMKAVTVPRVFHLLPDKGKENIWCACPACRAFSPYEQYIIAVISAADVLAKIDPDARLAFYNFGVGPDALSHNEGITPRNNMISVSPKI